MIRDLFFDFHTRITLTFDQANKKISDTFKEVETNQRGKDRARGVGGTPLYKLHLMGLCRPIGYGF